MPRPFTYLLNKTPRRQAISQPEGTFISACHVGPVDDAPQSTAALKDLGKAWAELEAAAKESGVIKFHACSRTGKQWQDDPASVRAVADLLRESPGR